MIMNMQTKFKAQSSKLKGRFNLRDDLGEKNNLAVREPVRVKQLDALIEKFLTDTKAVVPIPNLKLDSAKYRPESEGKQQPKGKAAKKAGSKHANDTTPAACSSRKHAPRS